jgi:hypothetical protein
MPSEHFDPYKDALVIEEETIWPAELGPIDGSVREFVERQAHANPHLVEHLEYVRLTSGFCRRITITQKDLDRFLKSEENSTAINPAGQSQGL